MKGKRILLVEDEPALLEMIGEALEAQGYEVAVAPDAVGALGLLSGDMRFDHVVSDVVMPQGLSGIELAEHAVKLQPQARFTLVSAHAKAHLPPIPEGVSFLPKPYRFRQLLEAIES